jgi:hypothetical protein
LRPRFATSAVNLRSSQRFFLDNHSSPLKDRLLCLGIILLVLGIYSYPAIKTTVNTGSRVLPPVSAPDLSLYLNISSVRVTSAAALDPYYGIAVPVGRLGYLKFRLAFLLFRQMSSLLQGNLWWTLFLWNLFWWGLLCVLAIWLFQVFLPDISVNIVLVGLALLMFFNFGVLQDQLAVWTHIPSLRGFQGLSLPLIRPFFPQVPIPLVILYLGFQIKALQKGTWWLWTAMGLTQFVSFAIFPYAMLIMVGITAVGVFGQRVARANRVQWQTLSMYALACATVDSLFLFHGTGVARTGAPGHSPLIQIQLSVLPHRIGGMWLILAALTTLAFIIRDSAPEVRWSVVGLGLSNLVLLTGDAFFSESALQMSVHAGYFVQLTATVLVTFLVSAGSRYLANRARAWRFALSVVTVLLVVNGMLIAHATYRAFLPLNQEQVELTRVLQSDALQANDLVIARSLVVDDDCAWVPLVSSSHVLFCRNAQVLFSPEQNDQIQRFRQALYLYFTNRDGRWLKQVLDDPNAVSELTRLTFLGQVTTNQAERRANVDAVRARLLPLLTRVEQNDPEVRSFFSKFRRVLVVDNVDHPYFVASRLEEYLKIEKQQQPLGKLLVYSCSPRE